MFESFYKQFFFLKPVHNSFAFKLKFWRRRRRSFRAPVPKSTQIWDSARSKVGSTKWNYYSSWGEGYGYRKTWKCNLFVYDVLTEAKAKAPTKW